MLAKTRLIANKGRRAPVGKQPASVWRPTAPGHLAPSVSTFGVLLAAGAVRPPGPMRRRHSVPGCIRPQRPPFAAYGFGHRSRSAYPGEAWAGFLGRFQGSGPMRAGEPAHGFPVFSTPRRVRGPIGPVLHRERRVLAEIRPSSKP